VIDFLQWGAVLGLSPRTARVAELKAGNLRLVAITTEMLSAEHSNDWEPHVYRIIEKQYDEWPGSFGWHRYVVLEGGWGARTLVGAIGGFPKAEGDVEIGYSTLPAFQRRGYATAAARTLVDWLLKLEGVQSVSAQTYPRVVESIKVMERCGMSFVGEGDDPGTVRYRRMR
jgi:ribosomal-protein-alanine N-acetyltransferase